MCWLLLCARQQVKIRQWSGVASWLWVANDENCGICRMPFNGCCPDLEKDLKSSQDAVNVHRWRSEASPDQQSSLRSGGSQHPPPHIHSPTELRQLRQSRYLTDVAFSAHPCRTGG
ncbi:hypothetical protein L3Q82_005226 [Scortum barcoo]|uniref:Uncharacterized protein n=1 Tax=Scortum barcoo TaxID=214431 RepID=A0ACB8V9D4_9TELE|nr:hypothetical protein L3Q82_005226 [Scortum barcoo]